MEKLTQRDYFNFAIVNFGGEIEGDVKDISAEDMVAFFKGRIDMLDKKKSGTKAESESDSKLKADIKTAMADMSPSTATTILNKVKTIGDYESLGACVSKSPPGIEVGQSFTHLPHKNVSSEQKMLDFCMKKCLGGTFSIENAPHFVNIGSFNNFLSGFLCILPIVFILKWCYN